jgi:thioredoxin-like negative regulator of GroEL
MDPTDPSAAIQIAECLISQGEKKKALDILERISFDYGRYEKYIKYTEKSNAVIRLLKKYGE